MHVIDLDRYFARIGLRRPTALTRATLDAIAQAHVLAIPFENLDILLDRGVDIALPAIERKLVDAGRGGYCFEHNSLLLAVLGQLGFAVTPYSARVRIGRARDYTPARTHLFVRVDLDGTAYAVDVGVGGLSPTKALELDRAGEQATPHEPRRYVHEDRRWFHQAKLGDDWIDVCEFTRETMPEIDRIVANWYTSAHPDSHFRSRLIVARARPDGGRTTLTNRELSIRGRDGKADVRMLRSPAELLAALAEHFDLRFPPGTEFRCAALDWPSAS